MATTATLPSGATVDLPSLPAPRPQRKWQPRLVWVSLHAGGIGLLLLSGGWPSQTSIAAVYSAVITLTALLYAAASFRDPGYAETAAKTAARLASPSDDFQEALLDQAYCVHCHAELRARTKHCHDCCRCVRRMDHHCWWLGNCVGERTHCIFVSYLFLQTALLVATGVFASLAVGAAERREHPHALPPWVEAGAAVLCAAFCGLTGPRLFPHRPAGSVCLRHASPPRAGLASITLLAFQLALVLRGETTWECAALGHAPPLPLPSPSPPPASQTPSPRLARQSHAAAAARRRLKRHHLNAAAQLPPDERPYDRGPRRNIAIFCGCEADPGERGEAAGEPSPERCPHPRVGAGAIGVPKWCEGNQGKLAIRPAAAAAAAQKPTDGSYRPPL